MQALCFLAGANSIFDGDKLLTTPNNERSEDLRMFELLGLSSRPAFHPLGYVPLTKGRKGGVQSSAPGLVHAFTLRVSKGSIVFKLQPICC